MKNTIFTTISFFCLLVTTAQPIVKSTAAIPVRYDAITVLYGTKSFKTGGGVTKQNGDFLKFKDAATVEWKVNVSTAGTYEINFVYGASGASPVELIAGKTSTTCNLRATNGAFGVGTYERVKQKELLNLPVGEQSITLKSGTLADKRTFNFRSLELLPVAARQAIKADSTAAIKARANSKWLSNAGYGVMFHWTSLNIGKDGTHKPFDQAVADFDLASFVSMVEATGAGYVIFTIGHAEAFCPAPIASWEKYHPGHTTKRDLIAEMADALAAENIKLICYLPTHIVAKYRKVPEKEFTQINKDILTEMGNRYKTKVAGYWFDGWYQCYEEYPGFSFSDFFKTCKVGNPDRIVALNSWIYPPVSLWQEYWAGETASPVELPAGGMLQGGPAPGLRYQALLIMEPYWVQEKVEMPDPRFDAATLASYIKQCKDNGGSVTINLGIYQDGSIGEKALEVMKAVRSLIR